MLRVLVVDDQQLVRRGFAMVLGHEDDIEVVAEAGDGLEAIAAAREYRPDIVLMDIRMPELDGLEATAREDPARRRDPACAGSRRRRAVESGGPWGRVGS